MKKRKNYPYVMKAEDWLYEDGLIQVRLNTSAKYEELASIGNVIRGRYLAKEEERKQAIRQKHEQAQASAMAEKLAAARQASKDSEKKMKMVTLKWIIRFIYNLAMNTTTKIKYKNIKPMSKITY